MTLGKKLFFSACLLSVVFICPEKGIAQTCHHNATKCPYYNNVWGVPGSWSETCEDPSISCNYLLCRLSANCKQWNGEYNPTYKYHYTDCPNGVSNDDGDLVCQ